MVHIIRSQCYLGGGSGHLNNQTLSIQLSIAPKQRYGSVDKPNLMDRKSWGWNTPGLWGDCRLIQPGIACLVLVHRAINGDGAVRWHPLANANKWTPF